MIFPFLSEKLSEQETICCLGLYGCLIRCLLLHAMEAGDGLIRLKKSK